MLHTTYAAKDSARSIASRTLKTDQANLPQRLSNLSMILAILLCIIGTSNSLAQVPKDVIALAAMHSENYYYQSNVPYTDRLALLLEEHVDEIRLSNNSDLALTANEIGAARKAMFQIDAARFAISSGLQARGVIQELESKWKDQPEVLDSFGIETYQGFANQIRPGYNRVQIDDSREQPFQFIHDTWGTHGTTLLNEADLTEIELPVSFQFGLVQKMGYGMLKNSSDESLTNVIAVFKYNTDHDKQQTTGEVIYFIPELKPNTSVAILSLARSSWPLSDTEDNPRKFNTPFKKGQVKLNLNVYCDQGIQRELAVEIRDGLRLQMECLRSILVADSVFRASHGSTMAITKATGRGRSLSLTFSDGGKATLNNSWDAEQRDTDFFPGSTAFAIRIQPAEADEPDDPRNKTPRKRGAAGRDRTGGETIYTWRDGALISGAASSRGDVHYPVNSESEQ